MFKVMAIKKNVPFFGCLFLEVLPGFSLLGGVSLINHVISLMVGHWG